MHTIEPVRNGAWISLAGHSCAITFLAPDILRVKYCFTPTLSPDASYAVLLTSQPQTLLADEKTVVDDLPVTLEEQADHTLLRCGKVTVRIGFAPFCISVQDGRGRTVHQDIAGCAYQMDSHRRRRHRFAQDGFEHYYGFGEKTGGLNKFHQRLRMYNCDTIGYDAKNTDPLYKHIPFFLKHNATNKSWVGMFYDNASQGMFDMGCERSGYWAPYASYTCDGGDLDYYLLLGDSPAQVVRAYARLTGFTAMPPLKTMGYMASTMYYTEVDDRADQAISTFFDEMDRQELPCDGFHMSSGYTTVEGKRCVFNWNQRRFPDPKAFAQSMAERGIILSPNVKPAMLTVNPHYDAFAQGGVFLTGQDGKPHLERYWGGQASLVDFTSPQARSMWKQKLKEALFDQGIHAIWDDNNEFELSSEEVMCCGDGTPRPACDLKPAFANMMARTAWDALTEHAPNVRPYILSRAGYAGIQRYAQTWAGDNATSWTSLKYNIPTMLGMSLSGVSNQGCDVGGFMGPAPEGELFVRWVQNGIFQPRFCIHSCNTDNTVTQPWSYPEYTPIIRKAMLLRYTLALYLYSLMHAAHCTGEPVMRPMLYEFPEDEACLEESFDFCYGPSLLVANVVEQGAVTRKVYLPRGCAWFDWYTHQRYEGGQVIKVAAPLDHIPLFYREGSIIPLIDPVLRLSPQAFAQVRLLVESSRDTSFTLYQDDGETNAYCQGCWLETNIAVTSNQRSTALTFTHRGSYPNETKAYHIELGGRSLSPCEVSCNGQSLTRHLNLSTFEQCDCGWYYCMSTHHVFIRLPNPDGDFELTIDYMPKDLIGM